MRQANPFTAASGARASGGFTLIELVATLAILAVLAMVSVAPLKLERQRAQERELRLALQQIRGAIDAYKRLSDEKRIPLPAAGSSGYPPTLDVLVLGIPDGARGPGSRIYLLRRLPRDPLHPDPDTPAALTWGLRSYASPPDNPQPGADVFDVRSLAEGVGLNGVPYRQW